MLASNPEKEASVTPPFLVARDVRKTYGGVQALRGVSLTLRAGDPFLMPPNTPHNALDLGPDTGMMLSTYIVEPDRALATFTDDPQE